MTKQEFLNGQSFRVLQSERIGASSYKYTKRSNQEKGYIEQEIRSESKGTVIASDYHLTITKVTDKQFSGFAIVMDKIIDLQCNFEDLIPVDDKFNTTSDL